MRKAPLLLVYARGGPPLADVLPRLAAVAETHLLKLASPPPAGATAVAQHCVSVTDASAESLSGPALIERIVGAATGLGARGVLTFSEFALIATALAAERLGLPGPGRGVVRARSKRLMRRKWASSGVPVPRFQAVDSLEDLDLAWERLSPPFLLKTAWGAGSIGQVLIHRREDIPAAFHRARAAAARARGAQLAELYADGADELIAEDVIPASRSSWHEDAQYADYLSVEGLVVDGTYHPVCITERLPTLPPFVERGNLAPSVLPEPLQREIEEVSARAVNALGLSTCGTHTELKLLADRHLCLLETAASLGGRLLTRQVAAIHGVDLVAALAKAVLGLDPGLPPRMITGPGGRAAGSVNMIAADSRGVPWTSAPVFDPERLDLGALVSPGTRAEIVPDFTALGRGERMVPFDPPSGSLNLAGVLYLEAGDTKTLVHDAYTILDRLETAMSTAALR
ncbi:ATP-grasp domain-containing protein [Nonomuraea typhae]|uniref:ATP-grasp domain-containing protein n=1 Tax=Nonomuraea typhae TaxID=2603600 RepID=UPI0012F788DD|nr:ATP-grasp domain-containing protein [Nonomuraea typhae]